MECWACDDDGAFRFDLAGQRLYSCYEHLPELAASARRVSRAALRRFDGVPVRAKPLHGTIAGYEAERAAGVETCPACRRARAAYVRERRVNA